MKNCATSTKARRPVWGLPLAFFLFLATCTTNYQIAYEIINPPVDLAIKELENDYEIRFYGDNREADFKGYRVYIHDEESPRGQDEQLVAFCECKASCRTEQSNDPTARRRILVSATENAAGSQICAVDLSTEWSTGRFLSLRAVVKDNGEPVEDDDSCEETDEVVRPFRCSKPSNSVEIP